jgi:DNA-binding response OmpR family regulator
MNCANQTVLCIGNCNNSCESVTIMLEQLGYRVVSYFTAEEGLHYARKKRLRAIMLDNQLEDVKRVEIRRKVRSFDTITPIIFFSSQHTENMINKRDGRGVSVQA